MYKSDSDTKPSAAYMERTKIQLSTSYSPGVLFTFEGNLVVCESIPKNNYVNPINIKDYARTQIFKTINERVRAWFDAAMRQGSAAIPQMCVDKDFLNDQRTDLRETINERLFGFVEPDTMGYQPTLLTMVCNNCQLVKVFEDLKDFYKRRFELKRNLCGKNDSRHHSWQQMDIVFIHPSGDIISPKPWIYQLQNNGEYYKSGEACSLCSSKDVKIDNRSAQIGKRYFYCANCKSPRNSQWLQNNKEYIREFGRTNGLTIADIRMKPVSCRASLVHYSQQDMVIDFGDSEILDKLENSESIKNYIVRYFSIPGTELSLEERKQIVIDRKGEAEWNGYWEQVMALDEVKKSSQSKVLIDVLNNSIKQKEKSWNEENIFPNNTDLEPNLSSNINFRYDRFASKYNPFKLLVEHDALLEKRVNNEILSNGLRRFTPFDDLDSDVGPEDQDERANLNNRHRIILDSIGIDTLGLVREFKTFHYSYGFTRVAPTPTVEYINKRTVPVRLNLFPKTSIDNHSKHPIFILKQNNEAIYVKLNERHVRKWLESINPNDAISKGVSFELCK